MSCSSWYLFWDKVTFHRLQSQAIDCTDLHRFSNGEILRNYPVPFFGLFFFFQEKMTMQKKRKKKAKKMQRKKRYKI